jgi:hypothetical protein
MILRCILLAVGVWLVVLSFVSPCQSEIIGVYDAQKLATERIRLEKKANELWQVMYDRLLTPDERAALKQARLRFPTLSSDGFPLGFSTARGIVDLPIHSLLLLEDACTAYAWLYYNGYSAITINEYASMLKHRRPDDFPGGQFPPPLNALGIPDDALSDKDVDKLSLRLREAPVGRFVAHEQARTRGRRTLHYSKPLIQSHKG